MFRWIDRSAFLSRLIEGLSATLARQRGLPVVLGVVLIAVSFVISLINHAAPSTALELAWTITHHVGLLLAIIGFLIVEPLGQ